MSDLLTHIERSLGVDVDLDKPMECGSPNHGGGDPLAIPHGGEVTHWMVAPCGCRDLRCSGFVYALRRCAWYVRCGHCGAVWIADAALLIEL